MKGENNVSEEELTCESFSLKGQYHHDQNKLSTGHGIGGPSLR